MLLKACQVPREAGLAAKRQAFTVLAATEDRTDGIAAFIEKRKLEFNGRRVVAPRAATHGRSISVVSTDSNPAALARFQNHHRGPYNSRHGSLQRRVERLQPMQTDSDLVIRHATAHDGPAMLALLPRLAAFDLPQRRSSEELWRGDERVLQRWLAGAEPECIALVALGSGGGLLGATLARLRPELLSGEPSAHLEILVVAREAESRGIGTALIQETESAVHARGARSMTLHVFAANERARKLYKAIGYDGEILRYIKELTSFPNSNSRYPR